MGTLRLCLVLDKHLLLIGTSAVPGLALCREP